MAQILNFDVSEIFNIFHNHLAQAVSGKAENMHFYADDYREKYIKMLEAEIERLKNNSK
ncbi:MAG: hypothetical protein MUW56_19375 [Chryseobacterium sp.]|uniref:hypothetical protein n=1 Tax=Chryseobacterium sp. TaxID=1871047 RepID=UPI0025C607C2|nr:hypothetical protein [Chryseobacterium sp.]MCJ7935723.1 hypothetical protein [Chryseobacterium sp.]